MKIIALDDEKLALERLASTIKKAEPNAEILAFQSPLEALLYGHLRESRDQYHLYNWL